MDVLPMIDIYAGDSTFYTSTTPSNENLDIVKVGMMGIELL